MILHGTIYVKKIWQPSGGTHVQLQQEKPGRFARGFPGILDIVHPETHHSI
jgi:hypothetical protein